MKKNDQRGAVTLEACISVLTFLILMLFLSSLFVMFMAQNVTAHAALQTSQGMSLDVYALETMSVADGKVTSLSEGFGEMVYGVSIKNPKFTSQTRWYNGEQTDVAAAVRERFIAYLAGGDETEADSLLKSMNVVDGMDGLDFSESYVANDTLYIVLKYELEYDFNIFNVGTLEVEQKTCSKLWK